MEPANNIKEVISEEKKTGELATVHKEGPKQSED